MVQPPDTWSIPNRGEQCSRCAAALPTGCRVTVLLSFGAEGPRREDLCTTCGQSVDNLPGSYYWRHTQVEVEGHRPAIDYALLRELFERMLGRQEPVYRRLAYLVCLVLMRKRSLRMRDIEQRNGHEVLLVSRGADQPILEVPAPHLSVEDMLETREQLQRLLASDLPAGELLSREAVSEHG